MAKQKSSPPAFAKDAVATVRGWADKKTGEILVSQRGLPDVDESFKFRRDRGLGRAEVDAKMPKSEVAELAPKPNVVEKAVNTPADTDVKEEGTLKEDVKPTPKKRRTRKKKA